jgi:hypothetical protein
LVSVKGHGILIPTRQVNEINEAGIEGIGVHIVNRILWNVNAWKSTVHSGEGFETDGFEFSDE